MSSKPTWATHCCDSAYAPVSETLLSSHRPVCRDVQKDGASWGLLGTSGLHLQQA